MITWVGGSTQTIWALARAHVRDWFGNWKRHFSRPLSFRPIQRASCGPALRFRTLTRFCGSKWKFKNYFCLFLLFLTLKFTPQSISWSGLFLNGARHSMVVVRKNLQPRQYRTKPFLTIFNRRGCRFPESTASHVKNKKWIRLQMRVLEIWRIRLGKLAFDRDCLGVGDGILISPYRWMSATNRTRSSTYFKQS